MRLHTDVYRYFIVDVLVVPLKGKSKASASESGGDQWAGVPDLSDQHLCPSTFSGSRGRSVLSWLLWLLLWFLVWQVEKVCLFHWKGATEVKECLLRYIVLKTQHFCICIYRCVPVASWWLCSHGWRDFTSDHKVCPRVSLGMCTTGFL